MLEEAQELKKQGVDLVVGYFEPHARPDTIARLTGLEVVPRRVVDYRGSRFEDMDVQAVLNRAPQFCLVDEFPHTNVPGSERGKRWEDVFVLLDRGIDVSTTMNVQHLESLNDQVYKITGVRVRETIPDWIVQQAAEVVMVDLTPRALLNRLERGVVYHGEKAQRAKEHFFKESTLVALREFALRETAFEIESRHGAQNAGPADSTDASAESPKPPAFARELVLVYINEEPSSAALIRRGKRVADYLHGECIAVAICPGKDLSDMPAEQREALEKHLNFARNLHVKTHLFTGEDVADDLVSFSRQQGVTQIYLARPMVKSWDRLFKRDLVQRIARLARDMEVTIVAERSTRKVGKLT